MTEQCLKLNRPFSVRNGFGEFEENSITVNFGESVVFRFPLSDEYDGEMIELRVPFQFGIETGLIAIHEEEALGNYD